MKDESRSPDDIQDELDVLDTQSGNLDALRCLVERWQVPLLMYATRLTGDTEAARDTLQEAWISAVKGIATLKDPAGFRPWIYRIVQRRSADWVRRQVRVRKTNEIAHEIAPTTAHPNPAIETLKEAIATLPDDQRQLLQLHYSDGLRVREIAEVLEVPVGTIKSRLFHTRKLLRASLTQT
ncbi:MAG: RNA polymerase sigma factor (sigma-70 family) [Verrucomicrobiales bacterium]|jgi:RNA polymerase sigma factor (sigma-70 family)